MIINIIIIEVGDANNTIKTTDRHFQEDFKRMFKLQQILFEEFYK